VFPEALAEVRRPSNLLPAECEDSQRLVTRGSVRQVTAVLVSL